MARVVIVSGGYLGDVAVYIPIGRRLAEVGHAVTFVAPAGYAAMLRSEPFEHRHLGLDFSAAAMHADPTHTRCVTRSTRSLPGGATQTPPWPSPADRD